MRMEVRCAAYACGIEPDDMFKRDGRQPVKGRTITMARAIATELMLANGLSKRAAAKALSVGDKCVRGYEDMMEEYCAFEDRVYRAREMSRAALR